jgi:hypothetical protein
VQVKLALGSLCGDQFVGDPFFRVDGQEGSYVATHSLAVFERQDTKSLQVQHGSHHAPPTDLLLRASTAGLSVPKHRLVNGDMACYALYAAHVEEQA